MADSHKKVRISIQDQHLWLLDALSGRCLADYPVSTAKQGVGQQSGSGCTPLGEHYIRAKIGANLPQDAVLVGRRWTGEIYDSRLAAASPERDWILSRILWLCGCEVGENRLGAVDTMRRYIYIHGAPDTQPMGVPLSHGCVRMRTGDVVALFEQTPIYTPVEIVLNPHWR